MSLKIDLKRDLWYNYIGNRKKWSDIVHITTEYITLGQLLKFAGLAYSGGDIKHILSESDITVNGEPENRRGKKLYAGDVVKIDDTELTIKHDK